MQRVIIFEPYEEWSWNFQDSFFLMKTSYGLSCNKIWGVTHGTIWWFDMEWLVKKQTKHIIKFLLLISSSLLLFFQY